MEAHHFEADVRQIIRNILRRKLEDERGRQFAFDLQEDTILQHGIVEALKLMGEAPADHEPYGQLAERLEIARANAQAATEGIEADPPMEFEEEKKAPETKAKISKLWGDITSANEALSAPSVLSSFRIPNLGNPKCRGACQRGGASSYLAVHAWMHSYGHCVLYVC